MIELIGGASRVRVVLYSVEWVWMRPKLGESRMSQNHRPTRLDSHGRQPQHMIYPSMSGVDDSETASDPWQTGTQPYSSL